MDRAEVKCCFTPTETVGLLGTGAQDDHLDFHTAPELCGPMLLKSYFTSTETVGLLGTKLQALIYDILPSTTAVFVYAIGSRKLSANEPFFVGVQTIISLLQTTQIKQGVSFIAVNKVYTSTNKTTIV